MIDDAPATPLLLSLADVCARLNISRTTLHQIRHNGTFGPSVHKLGGKCLVRADELAAWVAAGMPHRNQWQGVQQPPQPRLQLRPSQQAAVPEILKLRGGRG